MTKYVDLAEFRDEGYLQEANRQFFHPLGLALELDMNMGSIKVWDYRNDSEGISFEGMDLMPKANRVSDLAEARLQPRLKGIGYWIQPTGTQDQQRKEQLVATISDVVDLDLSVAYSQIDLLEAKIDLIIKKLHQALDLAAELKVEGL